MVNRRRCVRWEDIKSSVVGFKICAITAGIKKYKSITKKKKNKHDEILLLTKTNPAFASLFGIPIGVRSSVVGLRICSITAGIKEYKLISQKKKKKHNKILLLPKTKLNTREVSASRVLIN